MKVLNCPEIHNTCYRFASEFNPLSGRVGLTSPNCGSAANNWLDEGTPEVKEIWAALKLTTLATSLLLS